MDVSRFWDTQEEQQNFLVINFYKIILQIVWSKIPLPIIEDH